jgi:hypothetical protein
MWVLGLLQEALGLLMPHGIMTDNGTPLPDRGFANVPALSGVADLHYEILAAGREHRP